MNKPTPTSKVLAAAGPKNARAVSISAPMNAKVFAAAAEAGVKVSSPKPAPRQKR